MHNIIISKIVIFIIVQGNQELLYELTKDNPDLEKVKADNRDLISMIAKTPV